MMPLVLLHGFLGDGTEWAEVHRGLAASLPCVCPDLEPADSWDEAVAQVIEWLPERCLLGGYSMGGRVAMAVAQRVPERLAGLIVISANPGLADSERADRAAADERIAQRLLQDPLEEFLNWWYSQPVFAGSTPEIRRDWIHDRQTLDRPRQANLLRCFSVAQQPNLWHAWTAWEFPLLGIAGTRDEKYAGLLRQMQSLNPRLQTCFVPNVGHAVHREAPEAVVAAIQSFVQPFRGKEDDS